MNNALSPDLLHHQLLDLLGVDQQLLDAGRLVDVGEPEDDPVVGPDHVDFGPVALPVSPAGRQRPRGMDPGSEGGEQYDAPIADLVAELLDDDGAVGG